MLFKNRKQQCPKAKYGAHRYGRRDRAEIRKKRGLKDQEKKNEDKVTLKAVVHRRQRWLTIWWVCHNRDGCITIDVKHDLKKIKKKEGSA